jgi:hypothetical protein
MMQSAGQIKKVKKTSSDLRGSLYGKMVPTKLQQDLVRASTE